MNFPEITGSESLAANRPLSYLGKQLNIEYLEKKLRFKETQELINLKFYDEPLDDWIKNSKSK